MDDDARISARHKALEAVLNERQRRLHAAVEAKVLGHGGVKRVHAATGVARGSILAGLKELEAAAIQPVSSEAAGRVRRAGAGPKKLAQHDPLLLQTLERLIEPTKRGDPESPLRWTCKSLMQLARELNASGHPVSHVCVGVLLKQLGYSLQRMFSVDPDVGVFDHFFPARKIGLDLLSKFFGLVAYRLEAAFEITVANFRECQHSSHFPLKAINDGLRSLGRRQKTVP